MPALSMRTRFRLQRYEEFSRYTNIRNKISQNYSTAYGLLSTAGPIISSSARVASLASSLLSTLWEKTRIRPHRCAILQFMQSMGKKVAAMYCCSQLCITSRENIVCVILIKKIIILLIRTYCLIENVTFTCYSLCS